MKQRSSYLLISAAVILIDQLTKWMATNWLHPYQSFMVIPDYFNLTLVHNTGMAFGLFAGEHSAYRSIFLSAISLAALVMIVYLSTKVPLAHRWLHLGLSLIFGGALGNIIDRIRLQYVVDFLDFHWRGHSWPAFNAADACICIGMGLLMFDFILGFRRNEEHV